MSMLFYLAFAFAMAAVGTFAFFCVLTYMKIMNDDKDHDL